MRTVLFTLEARDKGLAALLVETQERIRRLNAELRKADEGSAEYRRLTGEIALAKKEMGDARDQQKQLNRELKALQVPTDSLAGLRLQYSKLVDQIARLSEAERSSNFGKALVQQAAGVKENIDKVEQSVGRFTGNVGNYKSAFDGLLPVVTKVGFVFSGLFAALSGGSKIVNTTREFEKLFATLKQSVGSETAAAKVFEDIQTFAAETPFQINELVAAFVKLENRNFNPTIEQLRTIGDIATSQGKSVDQFVEAILDAQTGEFERLKEFGIVARKNGDELNVTFRGQKETIANTSEAITGYLLKLGDLPGITGSATAVAKTLDGTLSNMEDNFTRLFATIGSSGGVLNSLAQTINTIVGGINDYLKVPLSDQLKDQQQEFNGLVTALIRYNSETETTKENDLVRTNLIGELNTKYGDYLGNIDLNNASEIQLRDLMDRTNKEFEKRIFLQLTQEKSAELFKVVTARAQEYAQGLQVATQAEKAFREEAVKGTNEIGAPVLNVRAVEEADKVEFALALQKKSLSTAEQAYQDYQKEIENTAKVLFGSLDAFSAYRKAQETPPDPAKSVTGKAKEEAKAAEGSLEALRKRVQELTQQLEKAPPNQIPAILGDLVKAEKELAALEKSVARLRVGKTPEAAPSSQEVQVQVDDIELQQLQTRIDALAQGLDVPPIALKVDTDPLEGALLDIVEFNERRLEDEEYTDEEIMALRQGLTDANLDRLRREAEEEAAAAEKRKEITDEVVQQGIEIGERLAAAMAQIENNRVEKNKALALKAAETEYTERLKKAKGNTKKEEQIRLDYEKKKEAIERDAAKKRQDIAVKEAIIQGALAVIKALPNYVLAAAIAVFTAIEVAVIKSQQFARGGFLRKLARGGFMQAVQNAAGPAPSSGMPAPGAAPARAAQPFAAGGFTEELPSQDQAPVGPPPARHQPFAAGGFTEELPSQDQATRATVRPQEVPVPSVSGIAFARTIPAPQTILDIMPGKATVKAAIGGKMSDLVLDLGMPGLAPADLPNLARGGYAGAGRAPADETGRRPAGVIWKPWGAAVLHEGEYIAPASQVEKYPSLFNALDQDRIVAAKPYAAGGFTVPPIPTRVTGGTQEITSTATFSEDQVLQIAATIATETARATAQEVRAGLADGLYDADRRLERKEALTTQTNI